MSDNKVNTSIIVDAGTGHAVHLAAGEAVRIGLPEGPQVADLFAFALPDLTEALSTAHTRSCLERLTPVVGDAFYSSQRRPMLTLVEDTSPGVHDLLLSACDQERYTRLGHPEPHANCADNVRLALADIGLEAPFVPDPVNLFENVALGEGGALAIRPPPAVRGDAVTLRAEMDQVLVVSACPMDLVPTNGADCRPKAISLEFL